MFYFVHMHSFNMSETILDQSLCFRTRICPWLAEFGNCKYGLYCHFAHNPQDIRTVEQNRESGLFTPLDVKRFLNNYLTNALGWDTSPHQQQNTSSTMTLTRHESPSPIDYVNEGNIDFYCNCEYCLAYYQPPSYTCTCNECIAQQYNY